MENQARFAILVLQRIRDAVGDDFIVEMRFSVEEGIEPITAKPYIPDVVTENSPQPSSGSWTSPSSAD